MSVAAQETGPVSTGGGPGPDSTEPERGGARPGWTDGTTAGVRPRAGRACATPRLARRMDRRPPPRLRTLHAVRTAAAVREDAASAPPRGLDTPAWDAALDAARGQVGPVALRLLSAVAEVLDGRRPVDHLAGVCPAQALPRVTVQVLAARRPGGRGTRVRGLRLCPLVTTGPDPVPAVEVAAALCVPAAPASPPRRTRAVAARFELRDGGWRCTELVVG